jgi:hypothetical protein
MEPQPITPDKEKRKRVLNNEVFYLKSRDFIEGLIFIPSKEGKVI